MKQIYRLYGIPCHIHSSSLLKAFSLTLLLLQTITSHAQVNAYARVTAINTARTQLTIDNRDENYHTFTVNQQVIVLQMQDNVIGTNTNNNANFGNLGAIAAAGNYEVATISAVNGGRTRITLTTALSNSKTHRCPSFNLSTRQTLPAQTPLRYQLHQRYQLLNSLTTHT
jgi:hypothetical protein